MGITGHLLYTEEVFVQCIEGPATAVEALWQNLQKDDRHHDVVLLSRSTETARRFGDWSMAFSSYAHFNKYAIPGFFPVDEAGMSEAAERCASLTVDLI